MKLVRGWELLLELAHRMTRGDASRADEIVIIATKT